MGLRNVSVMPVLAIDDLDRAIGFYRDKLGFNVKTAEQMGDSAVVEVGSSGYLFLYKTAFRRGENTVASFMVDDLRGSVRELRGRGVVFEDYDLPDLKTVDGIVDMGEGVEGAFFKDSEGNTIGISTNFVEALRKAA